MKADPTTIGGVARAAGVNVETVRYYQRVGLLREPVRPPRGIRRYAAGSVERIRFIKRAQQLGFNLDEVARLLNLNDGVRCRQARNLAAIRLASVEARLNDLAAIRRALKELIQACEAGELRGSCPIIDSLSGPQGMAEKNRRTRPANAPRN